MARVHTLADLEKGNSKGATAAIPQSSPTYPAFNSTVSNGNANGEQNAQAFNNLTQQSFLECLLPKFSWKRAVFFITIIDILVYIATVAYDRNPESPTSPSSKALQVFGASVPFLIRRGELWRLFCPLFLHAGILHLLMNGYMQILVGCPLEAKYGALHICLCYFVSGVLGTLISAATFFCNVIKVGASTSGFGLIGVGIGEVAALWATLEDRRPVILQLAVFAFLFVVFSLGSGIDVIGHVGGLMVGVCCGLLLNATTARASRGTKIFFYTFCTLVGVVLVVCSVALWIIPRNCA